MVYILSLYINVQQRKDNQNDNEKFGQISQYEKKMKNKSFYISNSYFIHPEKENPKHTHTHNGNK